MAKTRKKEHETGAEELFRKLKANPPLFIGTIVVLVLVIVSFVFVPAIPTAGGREDPGDVIFGYYNDKPIQYQYQGNNYFGRILQRIAQMEGFPSEGDYNQDFEPGGRAMVMWQRAFYAALIHEAILDEMKNSGYGAPPAEIDREVAKLPVFQEDGRFSISKYRRYNKNNLRSLWQNTEEDFIEDQYRYELANLRVSEAEKAFIGSMSSPERTFRMVSFPRSSYPDEQVAAFAASSPEHFRMVHFSKITIGSSEKEARQILDSIKDGKTSFEDAARNQSKDSYRDQGGDMGVRMAFDIYSSIPGETERQAVLSLRSGEYSQIVKDPDGWSFYRCEASPYNADFSQQENIDKARSYMSQQAGGRMEDWLVERAEEFIALAKTDGFEKAAEEKGLELQNFGPLNLNFGNVSLFFTLNDSNLRSAARNENFWRIAFTTPVNTPSSPFTIGSDVVVLEAFDEKWKDEAEKGYTADFYANGYWMYNVIESDLQAAVLASKKTKDNFFMTYLTRIVSPFTNPQ